MNEFQDERFVSAFERIASALEGLNERGQQFYSRLNPKRREPTDAIVTRVPNEEDRIKEAQGGGDRRPLGDWLSDIGSVDDDPAGDRERQWKKEEERRKLARTKTKGAAGTPQSGIKKAGSEGGGTGVGS